MMESQVWVMALHDDMMWIVEIAETKDGRVTELDVRNAGMSPTVTRWTGDCSKYRSCARRVKRRITHVTQRNQISKSGNN